LNTDGVFIVGVGGLGNEVERGSGFEVVGDLIDVMIFQTGNARSLEAIGIVGKRDRDIIGDDVIDAPVAGEVCLGEFGEITLARDGAPDLCEIGGGRLLDWYRELMPFCRFGFGGLR
jgi:hypothetical protein